MGHPLDGFVYGQLALTVLCSATLVSSWPEGVGSDGMVDDVCVSNYCRKGGLFYLN